jgi:diguanylate cyclase (GGDEF)-like protein
MSKPLEARAREALAQPGVAESELGQLVARLLDERAKLLRRQERIVKLSDGYQTQLREANLELCQANMNLTKALNEVRTIAGFLPVCYCCKKIRDDQGYWDEVESYLAKNSDAVLSQGICPTCIQEGMTTLVMPKRTHQAPGSEDQQRLLESLLAEGVDKDNPLLGRHLDLARRYSKASRRLDKISKISDGFQGQLKELNHALQRASLTDTLTGIANRRAMLERLKSEANRTQRGGKPFSVLMLDLDHFKRINDTHGHEAGDLVIMAVAQTLENNLRNFDFCARWGGEEFLVLLTSATIKTAVTVSEKLRAAVAAHEVSYEGERIAISFSGGIAQHSPDGNVNETLRDADRALYVAKTQGRNRVITANSLATVEGH